MSHTFEVTPNLEIPEYARLFKTHECDKPWIESANIKGETLYAIEKNARCGDAPLFMTIGTAFNTHVPMAITPDAVWLTILVGLTNHIDTDPEGMRHHFVSFEGKKELVVDLFAYSLRAVTPTQWDYSIQEFSKGIEDNILPKRHSLIINNFSTTTEVDRLTSKVVLMAAMKHFFEYTAVLCCGFSKVTVEGTVADWEDIINRAHALSEFGLEWWTQHLIPVLEQFKAACAGSPDIEFWKKAYLTHSIGSGGDYGVSGWIHVFYPYLSAPKGYDRNKYLDWTNNDKQGLHWTKFPSSLVAAPVTVKDNGTDYDCEFYGGLVGVSMADDLTVRPESGYVIKLKVEEQPHPKGWQRSKGNSFSPSSIHYLVEKHQQKSGTSGMMYRASEPEFVGKLQTGVTVLSADDPSSRKLGFSVEWKEGITAFNPRGLEKLKIMKNED